MQTNYGHIRTTFLIFYQQIKTNSKNHIYGLLTFDLFVPQGEGFHEKLSLWFASMFFHFTKLVVIDCWQSCFDSCFSL